MTTQSKWLERELGPGGIEGRVGPVATEARASDDDGKKGIKGYASVFNSPTVIRGLFQDWEEEVVEGAFRKTLKESKRILSAFNHDLGRLLGTTDSKTARFSEDKKGLEYDVDIDDRDPLALSAWSQVDTGKVNGASIWFRVLRQEIILPKEDSDDLPKRKIHEIQLFEGGPVVNPAFETTTATTRQAMYIDGALRALEAPAELRASLAVDAMFDPDRFEGRLKDLLASRPELRSAVCGCDHDVTSNIPDLQVQNAKITDLTVSERAGDTPPAPGTPPTGAPADSGASRTPDSYRRTARGFAARFGLPLAAQ